MTTVNAKQMIKITNITLNRYTLQYI